MKIFCTGNSKKKHFYETFYFIQNILLEYNVELFIDQQINSTNGMKLKKLSFNDLNKQNDIDFVFSIGGDGALLNTIRNMQSSQKPVLGIHIGNLGFLNQINKNNIKKNLDELLKSKDYTIIKHSLLSGIIKNKTQKMELLALNEITINHGNLTRMIKLRVSLNNEFLNDYACDGIIISTPLGSTAYSLSAGGPIVEPDVNAVTLTPISPHSLSARPIVVNDKSKIKINFIDLNSDINIAADGQIHKTIKSKSIVYLCKSNIYAKFVYLKSMDSYYAKLRNKLNWNGSYNS